MRAQRRCLTSNYERFEQLAVVNTGQSATEFIVFKIKCQWFI